MVAEDLGAGVDFVELFVELREPAIREKDAIRVVAIEFAAQTIEGGKNEAERKKSNVNSPL